MHKSVNAQACQKLDESLYDFEIRSHVAPKPAVNRITYSQSINAYLIWDRARSEFGPGPDLIWVRDPNRFRHSANPIFTLRVISFSKCRDATNHSHCRKKKKKT